jgi:hypothetical protein
MASALDDHPDRQKWNTRYATLSTPAFQPHSLLERATAAGLPSAPALELAAGPSGNALMLAEAGQQVTVVDVSDVALNLLEAEARRRGVLSRLELVQADLMTYVPRASHFGLVLCTMYWERSVFPRACAAVMPCGLLAWEAFSIEQQRYRPRLPSDWCLGRDEPASLLPDEFEVIEQTARVFPGSATNRLVARRRPSR